MRAVPRPSCHNKLVAHTYESDTSYSLANSSFLTIGIDLEYIGVDPRYQRRGIGRMLLLWGIDQAMQQGKDCYLFSTPAGRPAYESVGFAVRKVVPVFGVPHYSMIRRHVGGNTEV